MIAIETSALCNRSCVFCPNGGTTRPDELMPMELIHKIVAELKDLNYAGCVTLYNYNEPLRDKRIHDIIRHIATELPRACISLSSNGDYFKRPADIQKLFDAGARQLTINIYSANDGCGKEARENAGVLKALARANLLDSWLTELNVDRDGGLYTHAPRGSRRARVERKFGITKGSKKLGQFELQNRAGNIDWFKAGSTEPLQKMCVRPFRFMVVNWDGGVTLCCNDYHQDVPMGSITAQTLVQVWNSERFNAYRVALLAKDRDVALCRTCDYGGGSYSHMVETVTLGTASANAAAVAAIRTL